jgi:hypothetical protein
VHAGQICFHRVKLLGEREHLGGSRALFFFQLLDLAAELFHFLLDFLDFLLERQIGGPIQVAGRRAAGAQQPLELECGYHIGDATVAILRYGGRIEDIVAGCDDDGSNLEFDHFVLLLEIDGFGLANLGAYSALLALTQLTAGGSINGKDGRNPLREVLVDGLAVSQSCIVDVRNLRRTLLGAGAAAGAKVFVYVTSLLVDLDFEGACLAAHFLDFAVGKEVDPWMSTDIQQLWRENSDGAIVGWKSLVQLGHLSADAGQLFDHVHLDAHLGQVQGSLNTGDSTADDQNIVAHSPPRAIRPAFRDR